MLHSARFCRKLAHQLAPRPFTSLPQLFPGHRFAAASQMSSAAAPQQGQQQAQRKPTIRLAVFDMDGTLTVPVIDFQLMRQRAGVGPTGDILDIISSWPEEEQKRAHAAIAEIEEQALLDMMAMPGLLELCQHLDSTGIPRGLITRNVLRSVEFFHQHHLPLPPFVPAISRECAFPYKPSPDALLHICETWGVAPAETVMIGDSAKDDVVCGNRAGAVTVLLDTTGQWTGRERELDGELRPDVLVTSLHELTAVLRERYELLPPEGLARQNQQSEQQELQQQI